ncbi:hypothetical protein Ancab_000560 [Ancistrocladus abbreviatus]
MQLAKPSTSVATNFKIITTTKITLAVLETHLQQCKTLTHFNQILSRMILTGFIKDTYAASRVLKFSTDSPSVGLDYSRRIFDHLETSNAFICNTLMRAYLHKNSHQNVISLYKFMQHNGVSPDHYTYPILIQASGLDISKISGKQVHGHVVRMGFDSDVYVRNTLINMYVVCGSITMARQVFDESPMLDSVSWNSLLAGYVQMREVEEARLIFGIMPEKNVIASNSMIELFASLGRVSEARWVFSEMHEKDMVSWSALISCYGQNGMHLHALVTFKEMITCGTLIDEVVVVSVLSACAHLLAIEEGRSVHGLALRIGIDSYVNLRNACIHMYAACGDLTAAEKLFNTSCQLDLVSWNSMISGYLKCRFVDSARILFDAMPEKDVLSWGAMIAGYAQNDRSSEALALFQEMQLGDISPDETTLVSAISACTHLDALDQGKKIHAYARENGFKINIILGTTLINMYMKCGCVENALEVFHGMEEKGVSTWNAVILGFSMNGLSDKSLEMFTKMKRCGVLPNEISFIGVLGACRHMGLVDEGRYYFNYMVEEHKIQPNVKHYGCMVDLLGRAGLLREAEELIISMPMAPDVATWGALLGACEKHGENEMGERIGRKLIELHPNHDGFHVLLSNTYASKGHWSNAYETRGKMTKHGVAKIPGCSLIEAY